MFDGAVHANSPCTNQSDGRGLAFLVRQFAFIKPVAKNPEAQARLVLDAEIIPRRASPFCFHHSMAMRSGPSTRTTACVDAAPGELMRRAVGHGCERHLDGLRPVEQPQRPQRRLALDALRPRGLRGGRQMMLRGYGHHRALGDMGILRQMHDHALAADARGDAVDQRGQFVIVMDIGVEIALLLHHDFGAAGGEPDEIEAEAGIEGIVERIEPLAEQAVDHLWLRHRTSGIDR